MVFQVASWSFVNLIFEHFDLSQSTVNYLNVSISKRADSKKLLFFRIHKTTFDVILFAFDHLYFSFMFMHLKVFYYFPIFRKIFDLYYHD